MSSDKQTPRYAIKVFLPNKKREEGYIQFTDTNTKPPIVLFYFRDGNPRGPSVSRTPQHFRDGDPWAGGLVKLTPAQVIALTKKAYPTNKKVWKWISGRK